MQQYAEREADAIRYREDHPFLTFGKSTVEFALFDIALGDVDGGTVYAADLSGDGLKKMYTASENLSKIVSASVIKGFTGGNSRTVGNTDVKGKNVRIDIEIPTGQSTGNVHIHIDDDKIFLNSIDDIGNLPKSIRKSDKVTDWIKKAFKLLNKFN